MDKPATDVARTALETLMFAKILEPSLRGSGAIGSYEAQSFAKVLVRKLEETGRDGR